MKHLGGPNACRHAAVRNTVIRNDRNKPKRGKQSRKHAPQARKVINFLYLYQMAEMAAMFALGERKPNYKTKNET